MCGLLEYFDSLFDVKLSLLEGYSDLILVAYSIFRYVDPNIHSC